MEEPNPTPRSLHPVQSSPVRSSLDMHVPPLPSSLLKTIPSTLLAIHHALTGGGLGLDGRTLGAGLADDGTPGTGLGVLDLVGLLYCRGGGLLLLALLDGLLAGGAAGLGPHRPALLDHIEGCTNDGTLGLDCAAGALLGDLL